jgi:putative ABC transport system substrate-binding protein
LKKFFLVIFALICFSSAAAHAHDVLVVQGLRVKPHDEALHGFRSACGADVRRVYLADLEGTDIVRLVREEQPRLILAIGADALKKLRPVKDVPIVYLMVVNPQAIVKGSRNMTGVAMNVPPEEYLDLLARISPRPKSVGVVYDPAKTGHQVKRAQQEARAYGFDLLTREVRSHREVAAAINNLKGMVDALWILPDTTVVTPETVELFLLASQEYHIPVISFAGKYVEMGALAALDIDVFDQGTQAGEMAAKILNGTDIADLTAAVARRASVKVNRSVAKKLGITLQQ